MRHIETYNTERIGYDFYCDIANRIVQAREMNGMTQQQRQDQRPEARGVCGADGPAGGCKAREWES